ncbi:MAG: sulfite exporter TauE/SafE family protein, partial [Candidatus Omnitrophica bacterium]|nr:sulfite exporter TauE/SafE family protein [Candidatus Omnitrophota bacterium]
MSFEYWFMFPVSIGVASIAMASGVEGATIFAPIFIVALGFPPEVAIGIGLITEVFGFASGLYAYIKRKLIDYKLGRALLMVSIPAAFLGSLLSKQVDADILKIILGMALLAVAFSFLRQPNKKQLRSLDNAHKR